MSRLPHPHPPSHRNLTRTCRVALPPRAQARAIRVDSEPWNRRWTSAGFLAALLAVVPVWIHGDPAPVPNEPPAANVPTAADGSDSAGDFGRPHPDAAPELSQFAFLIGHWQCDVDYLGPDWKTRQQGVAHWTAYYAFDGFAIMDDFRGGFAEGYLATTIRAYDRGQKRWQGYWLDGRSGRWSEPLVGRSTEDGMMLETQTRVVSPEGKTLKVDLQYQFYDLKPNRRTPDRFRWRQNASRDGGKTWQQDTVLMSCRRPAGP